MPLTLQERNPIAGGAGMMGGGLACGWVDSRNARSDVTNWLIVSFRAEAFA
jgi:hypothetical protein